MAAWTDLDDTKVRVGINDIIDHFDDGPSQDKPKYKIRCPFHEDTDPSCAIDTAENQWYCHGTCKIGGDIHTYVALKERMDKPNSLKSRRAACALIDQWFGIVRQRPETNAKKEVEVSKPVFEGSPAESEVINPPYKYGELKSIDVEAGVAIAVTRGIPEGLARERGLAVAQRGYLKDRLVIPLHDHNGVLIGYAGRKLTDDGDDPKYLFPATKYGFYKSHFLYNLHRVLELPPERRRHVVIVEGFFGCLAVEAAGIPCVAVMGSTLCSPQETLLAAHFDEVIFLFDGDEAGKKGTVACLAFLGCTMGVSGSDIPEQHPTFVRAILLPDGSQPDHFKPEELQALLRMDR